ncbi:hypothetical protein JAB1_49530 [Janthinobacterium sp. MP5059B]|uniref:hypothetical protein n=1 Tax=Janthinobacterium sp. MP5059B TaxID=1766683 RepID=UPI000873A172|nr:hypothetical protein [Janthinobacterium sp. MP5059B]OEZ46472.1 hypothetical protein JAB1_49530 [Janthinobacterium sp. MP5059B]
MNPARAELAAIAAALCDPQRSLASLVGETVQLRQLVERHSRLPMDRQDGLRDGESFLPSGWAISPMQAGLCAREPYRSAAFIQGLALAVRERLEVSGGRPVRVLYAGCGPFALLALPVMAVLDADLVQFVILDVHAETLAYARELIASLGLDRHVTAYICADAAAYRIAGGAMPDVIVSETMNTALGKEPQVAILRNLHAQAPAAALLPASVTVHLGLDRRAPDAPCTDWGRVFALDGDALRAWQGRQDEQGDSLPAASIRLPDVLEQAPRLLTRIRVHGDIILGDHDCSLNLPLALPGKPALAGGSVLDFHYRLGGQPGLAFSVRDTPESIQELHQPVSQS